MSKQYCYGCKHLYSSMCAAGGETFYCREKPGVVLGEWANWIELEPVRCKKFESSGEVKK